MLLVQSKLIIRILYQTNRNLEINIHCTYLHFSSFAGLFFYFKQLTDSILELYTRQNDIIILIMALDIYIYIY